MQIMLCMSLRAQLDNYAQVVAASWCIRRLIARTRYCLHCGVCAGGGGCAGKSISIPQSRKDGRRVKKYGIWYSSETQVTSHLGRLTGLVYTQSSKVRTSQGSSEITRTKERESRAISHKMLVYNISLTHSKNPLRIASSPTCNRWRKSV